MKVKLFAFLSAILLPLLLNFPLSETKVQSQTTKTDSSVVEMESSTILKDIEQYKKLNPKASGKDLAAFGNNLLALKGFNYDISICDVIEQKIAAKETKDVSVKVESEDQNFVSFSYPLTLADSTKKTFQITAPNYDQCCCGYCYTEFPVTNITDKEMTLVADGKTYVVKRTKELTESEEYALVDNQTMRKEIRQWQVPSEGFPLGISEDGKRLYVEIDERLDLVLEISEDGSFKFTDRKDVKSDEGVYVENGPKEKGNDYIAYMRFTVGGKTYTVKFSGPCT
jgi:hypothetical protein